MMRSLCYVIYLCRKTILSSATRSNNHRIKTSHILTITELTRSNDEKNFPRGCLGGGGTDSNLWLNDCVGIAVQTHLFAELDGWLRSIDNGHKPHLHKVSDFFHFVKVISKSLFDTF